MPTASDISHQLQGNVLDSLTAVTTHTSPISELIHAMKYDFVKDIGKYCGEFLYLHAIVPEVDLVTSVPLHKDRLELRGFNQSQETAQELAKLSHLPYVTLLQRNRATPHQASIKDPTLRLNNISGSIALIPKSAMTKGSPDAILPNKNILLIDDVTTTGTTLNECARVLKLAGAAQVHGLAVAHGG